MKKVFLENSSIKCDWDLQLGLRFPDRFLKNQNWTYLWINSLLGFRSSLSLYIQLSRELWKYIETKLQTTCFYLIWSFFKKIKRDLELVSLPHFLHCFWRKMGLILCAINWPNFIFWLHLLPVLGNMCRSFFWCHEIN